MIVEGTAYWASIKEPNTTYEPMYTINLVVDEETASDFASRGHTIKQMDEGSAIVIKRKVNVANGSKVRVQYNEYDWEYAGKKGKGLDLQAVQIVDLVEYKSQDGSEFFDEDEEF